MSTVPIPQGATIADQQPQQTAAAAQPTATPTTNVPIPEGASVVAIPQGATIGAPAAAQPGAFDKYRVGAKDSRAAGGLGDPRHDEGYVSGLWQNLLAPLWNQAIDDANEQDSAKGFVAKAEVAIKQAAAKTPPVLLTKMLAGAVHSAYEEGKKSVQHLASGASEGMEGLSALARGDFDQAGAHAVRSNSEMLEGTGHAAAAMVPVVGPAAAEAGEDIGQGRTGEGFGKASGLIGTMLAPEAVAKTIGKGAKTVVAANEAEQAARADLAAETQTKTAAADAARTKATAAATDSVKATEATAAARAGAPAKVGELATKAADEISYKAGGTAAKAETFEQAADAAEEAARPLYAKINAVTNGKYAEFREELKSAWKSRDMEKVDIAEKKLDSLFDMDFGKGQMTRGEEEAAREAWRSSKTLRKIHGAVESAFEGPAKELADRTGVPRTFKGGESFQKRLKATVQSVGQEEVERVIGKDGLDNLVQLADATKNPIDAQKYAKATNEVAKQLEREAAKAASAEAARTGKAVTPADHVRAAMKIFGRKTAVGIAGAIFGQVTGLGKEIGSMSAMGADTALRYAWNQAATNPRVGKLLRDAVKLGADARVYAPLIAGTIIQENRTVRNEQTAEQKDKKKPEAQR